MDFNNITKKSVSGKYTLYDTIYINVKTVIQKHIYLCSKDIITCRRMINTKFKIILSSKNQGLWLRRDEWERRLQYLWWHFCWWWLQDVYDLLYTLAYVWRQAKIIHKWKSWCLLWWFASLLGRFASLLGGRGANIQLQCGIWK